MKFHNIKAFTNVIKPIMCENTPLPMADRLLERYALSNDMYKYCENITKH